MSFFDHRSLHEAPKAGSSAPLALHGVAMMHVSALCRWPAAGQDASTVHSQSARACDTHAGADSWEPLAVSPDGHVSSGVPWTALALSHIQPCCVMPRHGEILLPTEMVVRLTTARKCHVQVPRT